MKILNRVILIGRLTATPEIRYTPSGTKHVSVSIAVDRNFTDNEGNRGTDFINIVAWRQTAEFMEKYFVKGKQIAIEGSIQMRSYEDKQGNKRTAFEVVAEHVYFADSKAQGNEKAPAPDSAASADAPPAFSGEFDAAQFVDVDTPDSELPF